MKTKYSKWKKGSSKKRPSWKAKKPTYKRKVYKRGRTPNKWGEDLQKTEHLIKRTFLWGRIYNVDTLGTRSIAIQYPNHTGSAASQTWATDAGTSYNHLGVAFTFSCADLPPETVNLIRGFNEGQLRKVDLEIKPSKGRYSGGIDNQNGMPIGPPRLTWAPLHTPFEIATTITAANDVLALPRHHQYDLASPRKLSITPSTIGFVLNNSGSAVPDEVQYGKWFETNALTNTDAAVGISYKGLGCYWEWQCPPIDPSSDITSSDDWIDIYATYYVSVKRLIV